MATCTSCWGTGGSYGNYRSCYSCGGSGHGGYTNVACMACGGSGRGSEREWNTCWTCGGSGTVADPVVASPPRGRTPKAGRASRPARQRAPGKPFTWTRAAKIAFVLGYIGSVALMFENGMTGWPPFVIALLGGLLVARLWQVILVLGLVAGVFWVMSQGQ